MCSCILSSWENGIPLNKLFTLGGRLFNPPKRKHVLKRAESHRVEANTLGTFACNFSTFFRFLKWTHFRKLPTESEKIDRFEPQKFLKIIEHVNYLTNIAKYRCLHIQGARAFQTQGVFYDSPGRATSICQPVS